MFKINLFHPLIYLLIVNVLWADTGLSKDYQPALTKRKIITAGSAITEVVCALGHCDDIIATDRTSVFPEKMLSLPSIGYRNSINAENIIAQGPDLILAEEGYVKAEIIDQLQSTKIEFHALLDPISFEDTKTLIRKIAKILEVEAKGEQLIESMESEWIEIESSLSKVSTNPKLLFVLAHRPGSQMIAGSQTFAENLFKMAGSQNAVPQIKGFKPLNAEALIKADPDYVVFGNNGLAGVGGKEGALSIPGMAQTTAGRKLQFVSLDLVMMSNFGPRLMQAIKELAGQIHPEMQNDLSQHD